MEKFIYVFFAFVVFNIITFLLYGIDKNNARKRKRRISEKTLLVFAFFGGAIGAFISMTMFRHKTKHIKFKLLVPFFSILNIAVLLGVYYILFA